MGGFGVGVVVLTAQAKRQAAKRGPEHEKVTRDGDTVVSSIAKPKQAQSVNKLF